jgi:FkbM family methyltransferase
VSKYKKKFVLFLNFLNRCKFINKIFSEIKKIETIKSLYYENDIFRFIDRNYITNYRFLTFRTKEPDTLTWIKKMKKNSVFWDIGANVGLYSIFAAKTASAKVYAFEPSFLNLELLYKNININLLKDRITIIPVALSNKCEEGYFQLGSLDYGGALSTFANKYNKDKKNNNSYKTISITSLKIKKIFSLKNPHYIKIDVDGLEYEILQSLESLFKDVRSILVENIMNNLIMHKNIKNILKKNNFHLSEDGMGENQIWYKIN